MAARYRSDQNSAKPAGSGGAPTRRRPASSYPQGPSKACGPNHSSYGAGTATRRSYRAGLPDQPSAVRKPSRQLEYSGFHPSSRFAFAFDDPRSDVIAATPKPPSIGRPIHTGTLRGGFAPMASARTVTTSRTGAGSSSTMLYTPGAPLSIAATVARAASSMW